MTLQDRLARVKLLALDFDGVMTDNHVYTFADGSEAVRTSRADGIGIERLKALGIRVVVITSEPPFTAGHRSICDVRCAKLGLQVAHVNNGFTKLDILKSYMSIYPQLEMAEVAYVGNDVNDLECLQAIGVPFIPRDATEQLQRALGCYFQERALMPTVPNGKMTEANGGDGAVREVADLIADAIEQHKPNLQRVAEALG